MRSAKILTELGFGQQFGLLTYSSKITQFLKEAEEVKDATVSWDTCKKANALLTDLAGIIGEGLSLEGYKPILERNLERLMEAGDNICLKATLDVSRDYAAYRSAMPYLDLKPHYEA